jgi:hypothetical protein
MTMPGIGLRSLNANALIYRPTHRDDSKAIFAMSSKNILIMRHTEKPDVSDAPIHIAASPHGAPCEVIAVEDGLVVWAGPIEDLYEAGNFDALFCHDDDQDWLTDQLRGDGGATMADP